jgi:site-specific DNA-methyltransferase (adenine-specific)
MKPISNKVSSAIISPIREHSRKPDEARERIVQLFGDIPRIEMFARQQTQGWDTWGNEVDKFYNQKGYNNV